MRLPCPSREKLGDGTVAACAKHTTHNYQRIGEFVATTDQLSPDHVSRRRGGHRIPRFLRTLGHETAAHSRHGPDSQGHGEAYTADDANRADLVEQLSAARKDLSRLAELTDRQLDDVPPKDSFRFCDGQRTLEQVLTGLLKHQHHQVCALKAAVG